LPFPGNLLTSDESRHARAKAIVEAAPQLALGAPTVQWLYAAFRTTDEIAEPDFPESVKIPMLLFDASEDKIVSAHAIEKLASEMRVGAAIMMPGARHEILMENDKIRAQFWAAFDAFIPGNPAY
ncbi:MAG: alpha/beta hydrolase, partial [Fimbriimonadaceae bacterium]|nr:alpha/beta hydrolase [Alphaproteobacteria bacterium]